MSRYNSVIAADGVKLVMDDTFDKEGKLLNRSKYKHSADGVVYKKCHICNKWYPLSEYLINKGTGRPMCKCVHCHTKGLKFDKKGNSKKDTLEQTDKIMKSEFEETRLLIGFNQYSDAQIIRELRRRGYTGELTHTSKVIV